MLKRNIPNILSVLRIMSVPLFLYLFISGRRIWAVTVFVISGITDVVDGAVARKFNLISDLGKFLDPVADKLLQISVIIALVASNTIPNFVLFVFAAKEFMTLIGSILIYRKKSFVVVSNVFGKLSTVTFYITMGIVMLLQYFNSNGIAKIDSSLYNVIVTVLCMISIVFAIIAALNYVIAYNKYLFTERAE